MFEAKHWNDFAKPLGRFHAPPSIDRRMRPCAKCRAHLVHQLRPYKHFTNIMARFPINSGRKKVRFPIFQGNHHKRSHMGKHNYSV